MKNCFATLSDESLAILADAERQIAECEGNGPVALVAYKAES